MVTANFASAVLGNTMMAVSVLWQSPANDAGFHWNLLEMWGHMGLSARAIVGALLLMSAWSAGVMIDLPLALMAARQPSPQFEPALPGTLRAGNMQVAR